MVSDTKKLDLKAFVHFIIVLLFMFGFRYLPPIGDITPYGMQVIGIFIGVLYGWTTSSIFWPGFLGICALGFLEGNTVFGTLGICFSDNLVLTTLFIFCFAQITQEIGLTTYIANWCISRKFATGRPYVMLIMFSLAGFILSTFVNLFASLVLVTVIFGEFCRQAGFKSGDKFPAFGSIMIILAVTVGGGIFPFMGQSFVVNSVMEKTTGAVMNYVLFTVVQLVYAFVTMLIAVLAVKYILKPDVTPLLNVDDRFACYRNDKMTADQKQLTGLIVVLMLLLFMPGIMPVDWVITGWLKNLSVPGAIVLTLGLYYIINLGTPGRAVPFAKLAAGINWDLIIMFATIAPLVSAINSENSNIMPTVVSSLSGLLDGMGPITFMVSFFFIAMVISQFVNNVAIVLAFTPVMYSFGLTLGINPVVIAILASYCLNISFCTPTASGGATYMFSFKEWIPAKYGVLCGIAIEILTITLVAVSAPIIMALV